MPLSDVASIIRKIRLRKADYIKMAFSLFCLICGIILRITEDEKFRKFNEISTDLTNIEQIKSSEVYHVFTEKILNSTERASLDAAIRGAIEKEKGEINKFFQRERVNFHGFDKLSYKVEALIWHDKSASQIVESIAKINGSIAFINALEIEKINKTNLENPFIKVIISCELYQKH